MQNYTITPEGFTLHKPLYMPEARSFADVLDYLGEWDHATMSHHAGKLPEGHRRPEPRYIPEVPPEATARRGNEIGPYCSVDLSQLDGPRHRGIAVRATDARPPSTSSDRVASLSQTTTAARARPVAIRLTSHRGKPDVCAATGSPAPRCGMTA